MYVESRYTCVERTVRDTYSKMFELADCEWFDWTWVGHFSGFAVFRKVERGQTSIEFKANTFWKSAPDWSGFHRFNCRNACVRSPLESTSHSHKTKSIPWFIYDFMSKKYYSFEFQLHPESTLFMCHRMLPASKCRLLLLIAFVSFAT